MLTTVATVTVEGAETFEYVIPIISYCFMTSRGEGNETHLPGIPSSHT